MTDSIEPHLLWGHVAKLYIRRSRLGTMWVVSRFLPYSSHDGEGFKRWEDAIAEANYQGQRMRWMRVVARVGNHECARCEMKSRASRRGCIFNPYTNWLAQHPVEPQTPENAR